MIKKRYIFAVASIIAVFLIRNNNVARARMKKTITSVSKEKKAIPVKTGAKVPFEVKTEIKTKEQVISEFKEQKKIIEQNIIKKSIDKKVESIPNATTSVIKEKEYTKEELKHLYETGHITEDEYSFFSGGNLNENDNLLLDLFINGKKNTNHFKIKNIDNINYFPLYDFLKSINFTNIEIDKNILTLKIGEDLREITIDLNNNIVISNYSELKTKQNDIINDNNEIYIEENLFKSLFLTNLAISQNQGKINMTLNFATPEDIKIRLKNNERIISENNGINEITYSNNKKLFELGYLRTEVNQIFTKNEYEKNGDWQSDWEAHLEYQGALLYGEITANYDVKNHIFEDIKLRYDDLYKKHTLEILNNNIGQSGSREWELSFKKDKGYFITGSKNYVIKENVPIGSRVEFLYLGVPIEIKTSENGVVEFKNDEIKEDREYTLKIYEINGKISEKIINTTSDYNQQNKGEVEYDFNIRENHDIDNKYTILSNIYYGLTDNTTIGLGYEREIEQINDNYEYLNKGRLELVYSNFLLSNPYTFRLGGDKVIDEYEYKINEKNTKDDYSYDLLGQIDIKKVRLKLEHLENGEFYENKNETRFNVRYSPIKSLDLEYEREIITKNTNQIFGDKEKETSNKYNVEYSKSLKNILITGEYEYETEEKSTYGVNLYYTGFRTFTTKLENKWENDGKDYNVAFSVFSSGNQMFDYNLKAEYSEEDKDKFTFRFSTNIDDWFNFESFIDKKGNQEHKFGIDRITDLRNVKAKIKSIESSPVKVTTFIDTNDNNKMDSNEKKLNGVEVEIANQKIITDINGEANFYGVPNEILYDLNPLIRKPNFLLGNNKIQIQGKNTSTIEAFIPIKPMLTLTGIINIDDILNLSNIDKIRIYDDILVTIKDINGKKIDMAIPDEQGIFEISGLLPKKYYIEVIYMGIAHKIQGINETIQLAYIEKEDSNTYVFNLKDNLISMSKGEENL